MVKIHPLKKPIMLYHWSPTSRRKQINRYGLRVAMTPVTQLNDEGWKAPYTCFADTPSWAWGLSGGMRYTFAPNNSWDLWQIWSGVIEEPVVIPSTDRPSGIHEVRAFHRIYKRDVWYVATRIEERK